MSMRCMYVVERYVEDENADLSFSSSACKTLASFHHLSRGATSFFLRGFKNLLPGATATRDK